MKDINRYIDHTLLKPEATQSQIVQLCNEAIEYKFASVCINPCYVSLAKSILKDTNVDIATVVGFPLGATTTMTKVAETIEAVQNGANEIDMVINIGWAKDGHFDKVGQEIAEIVRVSKCIVKVIIETSKLTEQEIIKLTKVAVQNGANFVKTSTGFGGGGATAHNVNIMKQNCGDAQVKASGGIRDYATAIDMIEAGATRLGTSAGIEIIRGLNG